MGLLFTEADPSKYSVVYLGKGFIINWECFYIPITQHARAYFMCQNINTTQKSNLVTQSMSTEKLFRFPQD